MTWKSEKKRHTRQMGAFTLVLHRCPASGQWLASLEGCPWVLYHHPIKATSFYSAKQEARELAVKVFREALSGE